MKSLYDHCVETGSELLSQWHPEANGTMTPEQVTIFSNRKMWWICERGHAFQAVVSSRVRYGSDCPYCAGRKVLVGFNDLASRFPEVAAQWHPALNGDLTPQMVTPGSHKKVWWQCGESHAWQARVDSRTDKRHCGCPACAGKIPTK